MGEDSKLPRRAAIARILAEREDTLVVTGLGSSTYDCAAVGDHSFNFYLWGAMGSAVTVGLGLALAQPNRRVFALEGDGSLVMQLGCLSTIATLKPKNLAMIVMDNGMYQITGAQPTPAAATTDLIAVAIGCGLTNASWAADEEDFERLVDLSLTATEPMLIGVRIDDKPGTGATRRDPVQIRERFMLGLGTREGF